MKTHITLLLFTAILAIAALSAFGEQVVSGIISRETRWRAEEGPYIVSGDILVAKRANLIITAGTRIIIKNDAQKSRVIDPFDKSDSTLVSIRVQGAINCVGKRNAPVVFEPETSELANFKWRGIILDQADDRYTEIAFAEISGATIGLTIKKTSVVIRNSAFENNNIGIVCLESGTPQIYNNLITSCFTAAIKVERANPQIANNIIAFNNNLGLWCDNSSKITFRYNCVYGNTDGNFLDCDPELGKAARGGEKNKILIDANHNIMADPIFVGSPAETRAMELDINLQTDSSKVKDKKLLHIPKFQFGKPVRRDPTTIGIEEHKLSITYSPCINAGDPGWSFKNVDGTRNTIGPLGGPDLWTK